MISLSAVFSTTFSAAITFLPMNEAYRALGNEKRREVVTRLARFVRSGLFGGKLLTSRVLVFWRTQENQHRRCFVSYVHKIQNKQILNRYKQTASNRSFLDLSIRAKPSTNYQQPSELFTATFSWTKWWKLSFFSQWSQLSWASVVPLQCLNKSTSTPWVRQLHPSARKRSHCKQPNHAVRPVYIKIFLWHHPFSALCRLFQIDQNAIALLQPMPESTISMPTWNMNSWQWNTKMVFHLWNVSSRSQSRRSNSDVSQPREFCLELNTSKNLTKSAFSSRLSFGDLSCRTELLGKLTDTTKTTLQTILSIPCTNQIQ